MPVREIWGFYEGQKKRAGATSILIHAGVIALLFVAGTNKAVLQMIGWVLRVFVDLAPCSSSACPFCRYPTSLGTIN